MQVNEKRRKNVGTTDTLENKTQAAIFGKKNCFTSPRLYAN